MNTKTTVVTQEQLDAQFACCDKIASYWAQRGITPVAYVETYGCQQNEADSEKLRGYLSQCGYAIGTTAEGADVVVMNTCAIREHAEQRVFGNLGALTHTKRRHPGQKIFLCGCMAGEEKVSKRVRESYPHVDGVFSTHHLWQFPEILYSVLTTKKRAFYIQDEPGSIAEGIPQVRDSGLKAWVSIMYGCNNFCTYCIVPYVRGRERSRNPEELYSEVRQLVEDGVKEITLLGQNVNSYGKDLPKPLSFAELLRNICRIEGDFTLRFMTSHPKDATKELIDVMAENPKIAKAFHLPLQSGSNRILQRMNRHYTAESYLSLVSYMRKKMPDIALTSDIIVGFPGESEEDFEATLEVLEKAEYDNIYSFIYSPRKGTPAAEMPDQIPPEVSSARFARLLEKQMEISNRKNKDYTGCVLKVLVEGHSKTDESKLTGRSEKNRLVHFEGPDELVGQYAHVRITRTETFALFGILEK